ncbi:hypothetical protein C7I36_17090, partial [Zobellella taiwanensis]
LWLPSDPTVGQWRPCQSDCLPLSRGDAIFFQMAGFAGFAGQTSSRVRRYRLIPLTEPYIRATYTAHAINLPRTRGQ